MNSQSHSGASSASAVLASLCLVLAGVGVSHAAPPQGNLSQRLVQNAMAAHPQLTEVGISLRSARGCHSIASTDPNDVGERCESGDLRAMGTLRPYAAKESDGFDVSLPLRDAAGRPIGSLAMEFRLRAGQTKEEVIAEANKIAREMATQIASKASLYERK